MMNDTATTLLADSKASSAPPTNVDQPMTTAITGPSSTVPPEEESERMRFQIELEFVQGLANPDYLHYLAQFHYFQDKAFINYLAYLKYWKQPRYAKYIEYPYCLHFLDLLQEENFRRALEQPSYVGFVYSQECNHWGWYRHTRAQQQPKT